MNIGMHHFLRSHILELQATDKMYVKSKLDYQTCDGE